MAATTLPPKAGLPWATRQAIPRTVSSTASPTSPTPSRPRYPGSHLASPHRSGDQHSPRLGPAQHQAARAAEATSDSPGSYPAKDHQLISTA